MREMWGMRGTLVCLSIVVLSIVRGTASSPVIGGLESEGATSDLVSGVVLIRELGCAHCHSELDDRFSPRSAPFLSKVGSRVDSAYLRKFLDDPQKVKPGVTMPDVMGTLPKAERESAVEALTHYLSSSRAESQESTVPLSGNSEHGEQLFYSIGCAACHVNPDGVETSFPINGIGEKYSFENLVRYLLDPLAVDPSARMPDMHLEHTEAVDLSQFLLGHSPRVSEPQAGDDALIERGRILFGELRCVACHSESREPSTENVMSIETSRLDQGCLSTNRGSWPDYALSATQRNAIQVALRSTVALEPEQMVEVSLRQLNCVACHERAGYGGASADLDAHFLSHDPNLGEQGRIPPSLNGVGAKLKSSWLRRIVVQGAPARPYMKTRMPRYTGVEIDQLIDQLLNLDQLPEVGAVKFQERNEGQRSGRDLAGSEGLSCITCHSFKGTQVGAMGALDLTLMAQRVTREWFHHYLADPIRFSPETLMPGFWPGGESPLPEMLDGDSTKQIEALWLYTSEGYGMGSPKGIRREPMRLLAGKDEAVMLRRSYQGVGKRGIGVGYPGDVNLVYHSEYLCLSSLWQGGFLDPSGVWMSQGHGAARPLARVVIRFENVPELFVLSSRDAAWPVPGERSKEHRFKGYVLDGSRQPTFKYEYRNIKVEDVFEPFTEGEQSGLLRTLRFASVNAVSGLIFRVAKSPGLAQMSGQRYQLSERFHIDLVSGGKPYIVSAGDEKELRISIGMNPGAEDSELVLRYLF
jgi:cytochrome c553